MKNLACSSPNSFNKMPEEGNVNRKFLDILAIIVEDIMDY